MPDTIDSRALLTSCAAVLAAAETLHEATRAAACRWLAPDGRVDAGLAETHQFAAHGLAWQATYVEALRQTLAWATHLEATGRLNAAEAAMLHIGFAEYGAQLSGGIAMSQTEFVRPSDIGTPAEAAARFASEPCALPPEPPSGSPAAWTGPAPIEIAVAAIPTQLSFMSWLHTTRNPRSGARTAMGDAKLWLTTRVSKCFRLTAEGAIKRLN